MNRKFRRIHEACARKNKLLSANKLANTMSNKAVKVGIPTNGKRLYDFVEGVNDDLKQSSR